MRIIIVHSGRPSYYMPDRRDVLGSIHDLWLRNVLRSVKSVLKAQQLRDKFGDDADLLY